MEQRKFSFEKEHLEEKYTDIIARALSEFAGASYFLAEKVREADQEESLSVCLPHKNFVLDPEWIKDENFLQYARPTRLTYVLLHNHSAFAAAEFLLAKDGSVGRFSNIYEIPFLADIVEAIGEMEKKEDIDPAKYSIRIVGIPGIFVDALWLAPANADINEGEEGYETDLLVPLMIGKTVLTEYRTYTPAAFYELLVSEGLLLVPRFPGNSLCPPIF